MLMLRESALLFRACWEHQVAHCARCGGSFSTTELTANVLGGLNSLCPSCRLDMTDSIRAHLIGCAVAAALDAQNVRAEVKTVVDATRTVHKCRATSWRAGDARAEAESPRSCPPQMRPT